MDARPLLINQTARDSVGVVLGHEGHCVLISPQQAVTCAHVLSELSEKPTGTFELRFPNLGFTTEAIVSLWSPFDSSLSTGSDIAVLSFVSRVAPKGSHAQFATSRPAVDAEVLAVEHNHARSDGDVRKGRVTDPDGNVFSLGGSDFLVKGMSGTGLFMSYPGERLHGLVSAKPNKPAQSDGYGVPSDEILNLLSKKDKLVSQSNSIVPELETMLHCAVSAASHNARPALEPFLDFAREAMRKPYSDWREEEANAISDLQIQLEDLFTVEGGGRWTLLGTQMSQLMQRISDFCLDQRGLVGNNNPSVSLDQSNAELFQLASVECEALLKSEICPPEAELALRQLKAILVTNLQDMSFRPRQLSDRAALAARRAEGAFRAGSRALYFAIGQRIELASSGTIFVDHDAEWAPEMVLIAPPQNGSFDIGSPSSEQGRSEDEEQTRVPLNRRFAMARFAISFSEYDVFCEATRRPLAEDNGWGRDSLPAVNVDWYDATSWCEWFSGVTGEVYRLPMEVEWEYCCRCGQEGECYTEFNPEIAVQGKGRFLNPDEANFKGAETFNGSMSGVDRGRTVPVDFSEFKANSFKIMQMHGNTDEWCQDLYRPKHEEKLLTSDAQRDGFEEQKTNRVVRGGNWWNNPQNLRSAFRCNDAPTDKSDSIGFRPVREI